MWYDFSATKLEVIKDIYLVKLPKATWKPMIEGAVSEDNRGL